MKVIPENEEFIMDGSIFKWSKKKGVLTIQLVEALVPSKQRVVLNLIGQKSYNFKDAFEKINDSCPKDAMSLSYNEKSMLSHKLYGNGK